MAGLVTDEALEGNQSQANPENGGESKTDGLGVNNVFRLQGR
jgi:hypothetical protein